MAERMKEHAARVSSTDDVDSIAIASIEVRDQVYRQLLKLLSLGDASRAELKRRGLTDEWIERADYRDLPAKGRQRLAERLLDEFGEEAYGVPGIIQKEDVPTIAGVAGLLIPVRDHLGRISALKVRAPFNGVNLPKYSYLTSNRDFWQGPKAVDGPHVPLGTDLNQARLRTTEGPLKADICEFLDHCPTVAIPSATSIKGIDLILQWSTASTIWVALDGDFRTKPSVAHGALQVLQALRQAGRDAMLELWEGAKGIDDALVAGVKRQLLDAEEAIELLRPLSQSSQQQSRPSRQPIDTVQLGLARPSAEPTQGTAAEQDEVCNFELVEENGKTTRRGLSAREIHERLRQRTDNWPRRVGNALLVPKDETIGSLDSPSQLFAWLHTKANGSPWCQVVWADRGVNMVSRTEFYAYLQQSAPAYQQVELFPHEPQIPNHLYVGETIPAGDGSALAGLMQRFCPHDEDDDLLIQAFLMTLVWGGPPGSRPAFLITGDEHDQALGRGIGKSTLVRLAASLVGGTFDVHLQEDWGKVITRLLSSKRSATRVMFLDNVKQPRFSWSEVEAMITAEQINGHEMYVGDGARPNTMVVAITLNGASLSKDLAQRCVIIKIGRPSHGGDWQESITRYIEQHRRAILGDLIASLRRPTTPLKQHGRFGLWEREVLGRLPNPDRLLALIRQRSEEVDDDNEEARMIRSALLEALIKQGETDPDRAHVRFRSHQVVALVNAALNERLTTIEVGSRLRGLMGVIPELSNRTYEGRSVWVWAGSKRDSASPTWYCPRSCPSDLTPP